MKIDRWIHKSETMICKTCMYFLNYRCRRHAPTLQGYPAVFPDDWCGDHKLDKSIMEVLYNPTLPPVSGSPGICSYLRS